MKTKYLIMLFAIVGLFASCDNPDEFKDVIYFSGTEVSSVTKFTLENPDKMGISVRSSSKVNTDVRIGLSIDLGLLEGYNKKMGTNYKPLPEGSYGLSDNNTVIKAGKFASDPVLLEINSLEKFKDEDIYCVPVTIKNVEGGDYPVLESSRTMYVIVNKTIVTNATILSGTYFKVDFNSDPSKDLSNVQQLTMEARVYVNRFQSSNPYISTIMGLEENFILRFGDVKIDPNVLQLAGGGYPVASTTGFSAEKWYHIAATYDGKRINLYIDGVLNAYTDAPRGGINLNGMDNSRTFYIGRTSVDYTRFLNGYISEARVWKRALTAAELANGICAVSPDSPDLLAYWKFNSYKSEDEKNIVVDITGHGYDAVGNREISFFEGVRCP